MRKSDSKMLEGLAIIMSEIFQLQQNDSLITL